MNIQPSRHELEFGEGLAWSVPAGTAQYFAWSKSAPADASPRWKQVAGYNVTGNVPVPVAGESTTLALDAGMVTGSWQTLIGLFDGFDPEVVMLTTQGTDGRPRSIDRFTLPAPNTTDAATIAAQERKLLQHLLAQREALAQVSSGMKQVADPTGTSYELMDLATIDRRVAEVRARIRWFEHAVQGNVMPRAEFW